MDYIQNMFRRMDLQHIYTFILNGTEKLHIENSCYKERLENGIADIYEVLEHLCSDNNEFEKACADLSKALSVYEEIYTEIGMKAGARILFQLLKENDPNQFGMHDKF